MSNKNDGGAAFPTPAVLSFNGEEIESERPGMSLRAYVATKALQGLLANAHLSRSVMKEKASERDRDNIHQWHAEVSCQFADALIAELERDQ